MVLRKIGNANYGQDDFPLFDLLIDFVHNEAPVGEFARTGLLCIIEAASSSRELEKWIVESDLATLMSSGLGALYSQLSRWDTIACSGNRAEVGQEISALLRQGYYSHNIGVLGLPD